MQLFESVSRWLSDIPVVRRARNGVRVEVNEQVAVRSSGDDATRVALLRNLSISGACIRCDLRLTRGEGMRVHIDDKSDVANSEGGFDFAASVVTIRPSNLGFFTDYGLRITELNVDDARALAEFVSRRSVASAPETRGAAAR